MGETVASSQCNTTIQPFVQLFVPVVDDTYYIYNGQNRYDGSLFREDNGMMYGNTGTAIDLLSVAGAYVYNKDGKTFVYTEADVYSREEKIYGVIGGKESVIELAKTIEYRTYGVNGAVADVSKYTIIGDPITEWGNTYYNTKEGVSLFKGTTDILNQHLLFPYVRRSNS